MKKVTVVLLVVAIAALFVMPGFGAADKVGADKCKMCHKLQFDSWSASKHAAATPVLDCEGCHGPGSDYKAMSTMKDLAAAKAAGLIIPTKEACAKCHKTMDDATFGKVHAHKAK